MQNEVVAPGISDCLNQMNHIMGCSSMFGGVLDARANITMHMKTNGVRAILERVANLDVPSTAKNST